MSATHVTMAADGWLVVPARVRARLGMERGGAFLLHVEGGAIRPEPLAAVIERVQAEVRRYVAEDVDLVGVRRGGYRAGPAGPLAVCLITSHARWTW